VESRRKGESNQLKRDDLSAIVMAIAVVALIAGFAVYFNSPDLNKHAAGQGGFVPAVAIKNGTAVKIQNIDESAFKKAPELAGISGYINTPPITLADLKGKVVIVDFWTYSCINCIRTIPYLNSWYEKYASDGLVIVGVHTPEFEFEKNTDNVKAAVQKFGIKYPVVQDNDMATWNAYQNQYWPHKYLIDANGYIRYDHIGEGGYADTEKVIQSLLAERALQLNGSQSAVNFNSTGVSNPSNAQSVNFEQIRTPELYFGYSHARQPLGNPEGFSPGQTVTYTIPSAADIQPDTIYLQGSWKNNPDNMELQGSTGRIVLDYSAKSVNIVAGGTGYGTVSEDGSVVNNNSRGADVGADGKFTIDGQRLYNVVSNAGYGEHRLIIDVTGSGFQVYTFTFG
jgi:thiol-disulfide isomerase/thioredoxin